jgi:mono/diheme cytochrome c family protein
MKRPYIVLLIFIAAAILAVIYGTGVIRRGFSAADQPSAIESVVARTVRNLGIPGSARDQKNPLTATPDLLQEGRDNFADRCASCHGKDGDGHSGIGPNLYPKAPELRLPATQNLTDGEIHYIIRNGVRLTGMPALGNPHMAEGDNTSWKLVLFIRSIALSTPQQMTEQVAAASTAHYVGSVACQQQCQPEVHERPGGFRLRQHLEATLFHKNRRRLFSGTCAVGRDRQSMASLHGGKRNGLVGGVLSPR